MVSTKKMLLVIASMIFTLSLAFGATGVQAASLKSTAKEEISAAAKKQYSQISKYAKTKKYKITKKQKVGKLVKVGKNGYSQEWTMSMKHKKIGAVLDVKVVNTYEKKTKKVTTKINAAISYDKKSFGEGEDLKNVSALKKLMKKCSTQKGFMAYAKKASKNPNEGFSANWKIYCKPCRQNFYSLRDYLGHLCLSIHWGYVFAGR